MEEGKGEVVVEVVREKQAWQEKNNDPPESLGNVFTR